MFGGKLRPGPLVDDFLYAHRSGGLGLNNSFVGLTFASLKQGNVETSGPGSNLGRGHYKCCFLG